MTDSDGAHTFFFADLAGFTALTEAMGDADAADLAQDFAGAVRDLGTRYDGEVVKSIGDAVMVRADDPAQAIDFALCVAHDVGGRHFFPTVRVGMHTGPAVARDGDWFGATVNVAARVSGEAGGGEVLLTEATREAAGPTSGIELRERGRRELRNVVEPLALYAAVRVGAIGGDRLPIDPVCRMAVDPGHAAGRLVHSDVEYQFCSLACAGKFAAAPEHYARGT
jgi:class 3 adenylate cyclase/YHS domain-containing protein